MPTSPKRLLSASVLSVALVLGTFGAATAPTPARANGEQAAAIIGGLIALYALGRVLESGGGGHVGATVQPGPHAPHPHPHGGPHHPRPLPQSVPHHPPRLVAPERCRREIQTRNGLFRGYGFRCMQRNARYADLLPANCLRRMPTERGLRDFYAGRCLARNGWVREGRGSH